ncbi:hypothetical protein FUT69_08420 [Xylella taiwanensis]|uniref:Uncharacterized protein n=1 Tax=Xylella taiwanensis TaxID=1444770 RepID=Z9JGJ3_9GAMM|nr:hypothetical protein [Xylella taiwanensis]AXI83450.1 hypothetical protein AB672_05635 [Xylella taiwanensis]EWS77505.1 hypothetical protein AF72_10715 [Xylella taiwanensis]MCD8456522.1 hypothetical protein [Xylella taiwanensis]MCD8458929.1 hypothetical protein [Xylella taiwanensis]MCD8461067.1 hypothetical protein [Xylella taiwanensis]
MAKSSKQSFVQSVGNFAAQITTASGAGNKVTLFTVGSERGEDEELRALHISNTDTTAIVVNFYVQLAGAGPDFLIGSVSAAPGATTDARTAAGLAGLFQYDVNGNRVHYMQKTHTWKAAAVTAPAAGKTLDIFGVTGKF